MSDENPDNTPEIDTEVIEAGENEPQIDQDETTQPDAVDDEAPDADDAQDETGRRRGVRERLAEAEAERDALRDTLARQQQAVFEDAINRAGVTGVLMRAADRGLDSLVDEDGLIWPTDVTEAAGQVAADAGIPRRPKADPLAGRGDNASPPPKVTFGSLLKAAVENTG